jgi:hypothetical protein
VTRYLQGAKEGTNAADYIIFRSHRERIKELYTGDEEKEK